MHPTILARHLHRHMVVGLASTFSLAFASVATAAFIVNYSWSVTIDENPSQEFVESATTKMIEFINDPTPAPNRPVFVFGNFGVFKPKPVLDIEFEIVRMTVDGQLSRTVDLKGASDCTGAQ